MKFNLTRKIFRENSVYFYVDFTELFLKRYECMVGSVFWLKILIPIFQMLTSKFFRWLLWLSLKDHESWRMGVGMVVGHRRTKTILGSHDTKSSVRKRWNGPRCTSYCNWWVVVKNVLKSNCWLIICWINSGVAQVKIMKNPDLLQTASEQFLGKKEHEIKSTVLQTLEGHLRAILGKSYFTF